jgi:hypothetical protein
VKLHNFFELAPPQPCFYFQHPNYPCYPPVDTLTRTDALTPETMTISSYPDAEWVARNAATVGGATSSRTAPTHSMSSRDFVPLPTTPSTTSTPARVESKGSSSSSSSKKSNDGDEKLAAGAGTGTGVIYDDDHPLSRAAASGGIGASSGLIDNSRYRKFTFTIAEAGTLHGFAGYFDSKLYKDIHISKILSNFSFSSIGNILISHVMI